MTEATPLRAIVVEDEWLARDYLVELVEATKLAQVACAVATIDEARQALAGMAVDVVFVDVNLGATSGLDLVRELAARPGGPMVVVATAFDNHAVEAFRLDVVDYLMKPFTDDRVLQCLRRIANRLDQRPALATRRIAARRGRSLVFLEPEEVWAFEARERATSVHTPHGVFELDLSLAVIELSLGRSLLRVHRNWLVNAAYVKELDRDARGTNMFVGLGVGKNAQGIRIPVGRDRAQSVRDLLLASTTGVRRRG